MSFSTTTVLFGFNLHVGLSYSHPETVSPSVETAALSAVTTLCVQGLPEKMLTDNHYLSKVLGGYFKKTTGFEMSNCNIKYGAVFLTFTDASGE